MWKNLCLVVLYLAQMTQAKITKIYF
uniref:Uncharacterized protein n=1 Tax=Anguilla anguilla TaxID=7936 RepID=A0A0E9QUV7_ANGAN